MTDIIETIDGAIEDYEVSVDAMRWRPDGGTEPEPAEPAIMTARSAQRIAAAYGVPPALVGAEDAADAESLTLAAAQLFAEAYGVPLTPTVSVGSPADPTVRRAPRSLGGFAPSAVWVDEAVEFAGPPSDAVEWSAENPMLVRGGKPPPAPDPIVAELAAAVPCSLAAIDAAVRVLRDPLRPGEPWPDTVIADALPEIASMAASSGWDLPGAAANVRAVAHNPTSALVPHVEAAVERRRAERAVSSRVPVYRDDRPRWRSPYGPAGTRR